MEHLRITVDGKVYEVVVEKIETSGSSHPPQTQGSSRPAAVAASAQKEPVAVKTSQAPSTGSTDGVLPSPLAGIVKAIETEVGATLAEGDLVVTLEAMKMYTPVSAIRAGKVTAINVKPGDAVEEGQPLLTVY
ncbi:MAG: biotin/lipoyl-containing protein, partial [Luteolibacter sp.]